MIKHQFRNAFPLFVTISQVKESEKKKRNGEPSNGKKEKK